MLGVADDLATRWFSFLKGRLRDLVLFLVVLSAVSLWQGHHLLPSGEEAPSVSFTDLRGNPVRLEELRGQKVLLYFWAPWCGVCKAVTPNVRWLASSDHVEVVTVVSTRENLASVLAADPESFSDRVLVADDAVARAFAVRGYPSFYVIDEEGIVERSFLGYTSRLGLWVRTRF